MSNDHGNILRIRWTTNSISNKITAIKAVRAISGMGLGEAKSLVESAAYEVMQVKIQEEMSHNAVRQYINELEEAGVNVR